MAHVVECRVAEGGFFGGFGARVVAAWCVCVRPRPVWCACVCVCAEWRRVRLRGWSSTFPSVGVRRVCVRVWAVGRTRARVVRCAAAGWRRGAALTAQRSYGEGWTACTRARLVCQKTIDVHVLFVCGVCECGGA